MASSSEGGPSADRKRLKCIIHIADKVSGNIIPFKETAFCKVIASAKEWLTLGGKEGDVAGQMLGPDTEVQPNIDDFVDHGYHRQCYSRFTDTSKIARAKVKKLKSAAASSSTIAATADDNGDEGRSMAELRACAHMCDTCVIACLNLTRNNGHHGFIYTLFTFFTEKM